MGHKHTWLRTNTRWHNYLLVSRPDVAICHYHHSHLCLETPNKYFHQHVRQSFDLAPRETGKHETKVVSCCEEIFSLKYVLNAQLQTILLYLNTFIPKSTNSPSNEMLISSNMSFNWLEPRKFGSRHHINDNFLQFYSYLTRKSV